MQADISPSRYQAPATNSAMKSSHASSGPTEPGSTAFVVPGANPPEQPASTRTNTPSAARGQAEPDAIAEPAGWSPSSLLDIALVAGVASDAPVATQAKLPAEQPDRQEEDTPAPNLLEGVPASVGKPPDSGDADDGTDIAETAAQTTQRPRQAETSASGTTAAHGEAPALLAAAATGHRSQAEPKRAAEANVEVLGAPGDEEPPQHADSANPGMVAPAPGVDRQEVGRLPDHEQDALRAAGSARPAIAASGGFEASAKEHAPEAGGLQPKDDASLRPASVSPSSATPVATPPVAAEEAGERPSPLPAPSLPPAPSATPPAAAPASPQTSAIVQNVPLGAVAVEIGLKSLAGVNRFQIRLDPPELGRIDVRLDIGEDGTVKARLAVDRVETLALLQRDARTLERAFEQAGLKPSDGGVDLSLRDQGRESGREHQRGEPRDERESTPPVADAEIKQLDLTALSRAAGLQVWRGATGVDVRI